MRGAGVGAPPVPHRDIQGRGGLNRGSPRELSGWLFICHLLPATALLLRRHTLAHAQLIYHDYNMELNKATLYSLLATKLNKSILYSLLLTGFFWLVQFSDLLRVKWFFDTLMQDSMVASWAMTLVVELGMGLLSLDLLRRVTANAQRTWRTAKDGTRKQIGYKQPLTLLIFSVSVLGSLESFISVAFFYEFGEVTKLTSRLLGGDTLYTAIAFGVLGAVLTFVFSAVEGERTRITEREREKAEAKREKAEAKAEAELEKEKAKQEKAEIEATARREETEAEQEKAETGEVLRQPSPHNHQPVSSTTRQKVIDRDDWQCYHCGRDLRGVGAGEIHVDHFIPRYWGGPNSLFNLVTSCARCNISKGTNMPSLAELRKLQIHLVKQQPLCMKSKVWLLFHSGIVSKQKDVASILGISPSYVSSLLSEPLDSLSEELRLMGAQLSELVEHYVDVEKHDAVYEDKESSPDERVALVIGTDCPTEEKIWLLNLLDLDQGAIAALLNVTPDYVSSALERIPEDLGSE